MFASRKFRDAFAFKNAGLPTGTYGTGSTAGSAVAWSGFRKMEFILSLGSVGSANTQLTLIFATASASAGTYTNLFYMGSSGLTTVASNALINGSVFSNKPLTLECRGEWLYSQLAMQSISYVPWIKVFLSASNSSVSCGLLALGFLYDYVPASNYDSASYTGWSAANEIDAL